MLEADNSSNHVGEKCQFESHKHAGHCHHRTRNTRPTFDSTIIMPGTTKNKLNMICEEMEWNNKEVQAHDDVDYMGYVGNFSDTRFKRVTKTESKQNLKSIDLGMILPSTPDKKSQKT